MRKMFDTGALIIKSEKPITFAAPTAAKAKAPPGKRTAAAKR